MTTNTPNFDQIADRIVGRIDVRARGGGNSALEITWVAEQLRHVWNARGAADSAKLEAELSETIATATTHQRLAAAISTLDAKETKAAREETHDSSSDAIRERHGHRVR